MSNLKALAVSVVMVMGLAVSSSAGESRLVSYGFYGGLQAADIGSTRAALARAGTRESNPIAGTPVKILAGVLLAEGDHYLAKRGHHRAKWIGRIVIGVAYAYAVQNNLRVGK